MELVEGASLYEHKPRSLDEIVAVAQQVCAALEHAHAHGIVHATSSRRMCSSRPTARPN